MTTTAKSRSALEVLASLALATGLLAGCASDGAKATCVTGLCRPVVPSDAGTTNNGVDSSTTANSGTSVSAGTPGGNTGGGADTSVACVKGAHCAEQWLCTPWETAATATSLPSGDNAGKRTCSDRCACGTTKSKPTETATLPTLDFAFFQCEVEPILDGTCAQLGCHGSETGHALRVYARSKLRITGETWTFTGCGMTKATLKSESCIGNNECACWQLPHSATEWQRNYDAARGFALDDSGNTLSNPEISALIMNGLATADGGSKHAGVQPFTRASPEYAELRYWLAGSATGCTAPEQKSN